MASMCVACGGSWAWLSSTASTVMTPRPALSARSETSASAASSCTPAWSTRRSSWAALVLTKEKPSKQSLLQSPVSWRVGIYDGMQLSTNSLVHSYFFLLAVWVHLENGLQVGVRAFCCWNSVLEILWNVWRSNKYRSRRSCDDPQSWNRVSGLLVIGSTFWLGRIGSGHGYVWPGFWMTVCKTVRPMLSDRCPVCPVCNVGVLWPIGWMDQNETWRGGRPHPRPHCVRWGSSSAQKGQAPPPAIFGPHPLWPNGWIHQYTT